MKPRSRGSEMCASLQASKDQDWKLNNLPPEPLPLMLVKDWLVNESNMNINKMLIACIVKHKRDAHCRYS